MLVFKTGTLPSQWAGVQRWRKHDWCQLYPFNETILNRHTSYLIEYSDHESFLISKKPCNSYNLMNQTKLSGYSYDWKVKLRYG